MSQTFEIEEELIEENSSVKDVTNWRGANHRILLEKLENEFKIKFDFGEAETLINFKIIEATIISLLD